MGDFKKVDKTEPSPVSMWGENEFNQSVGFRCDVWVKDESELIIRIAARSYYRLYVDGVMVANGPARTAKGYCRVDEVKAAGKGKVKIAVEVIALDILGKYSNDCTLEPGLLAMEVLNGEEV